jgi:hypothetical protein
VKLRVACHATCDSSRRYEPRSGNRGQRAPACSIAEASVPFGDVRCRASSQVLSDLLKQYIAGLSPLSAKTDVSRGGEKTLVAATYCYFSGCIILVLRAYTTYLHTRALSLEGQCDNIYQGPPEMKQ